MSSVSNIPTLQQQHERPSRTLSLDLGDRGGPGTHTGSSNGSVGNQGRGADSPSAGRRRLGRQTLALQPSDTKVMVFWLESYEDALQLPIGELFN
jgi:hypothetical protein